MSNNNDAVSLVKEHLGKSNWEKAADLIFNEVQGLVDQRKLQEVESFNENLLHAVLTPENIKKVVSHCATLNIFREQMKELLSRSIAEAAKDPSIQALYFEFVYDGGDCCTGNIFLCDAYSEDGEEWASEFDNLVEGMSISEYFSYDPDLEFPGAEESAASHYVSICLLKICAEIYFSEPRKYPMGFADHDWGKMIRLTQSTNSCS